jgi:hypothetical protein
MWSKLVKVPVLMSRFVVKLHLSALWTIFSALLTYHVFKLPFNYLASFTHGKVLEELMNLDYT